MKHTKGPWEIRPYSDSDCSIDICHAPETIEGGVIKASWVAEVSDGSGDITEEAEANARLIAAAPTMLEALKEILGSCDGDLCADMNHHKIAREAIRLAEGR